MPTSIHLGSIVLLIGLALAPSVPGTGFAAELTTKRGSELYAKHCASCHGARLEGEPDWKSPNSDGTRPAPPHDNSGHTWHHGDKLLFDYTKLGGAEALRRLGIRAINSGMPGFGDVLADAEIRAILTFIKTRWGERERAYQKAATGRE